MAKLHDTCASRPLCEGQRRHRGQVDAVGRPLGRRLHPRRPLARRQAHQAHRIAAGIEQRAAAERRAEADIGRIVEVHPEARADQPHLADRALREPLAQGRHVRLGHVRIALAQDHLVAARGVEHRLGLGRRHGDRLLAQHVLAGLGGADRPFGVHAVGQRDVDRIDVADRPAAPRSCRARAGCAARARRRRPCPWPRLATALTTTSFDGATEVQNMRAMFAAPSTPMRSRDDAVISRFPLDCMAEVLGRSTRSGRRAAKSMVACRSLMLERGAPLAHTSRSLAFASLFIVCRKPT